ncbi:hypothetical protein ALC60_03058, partial [Trachymyrmex zeteki]
RLLMAVLITISVPGRPSCEEIYPSHNLDGLLLKVLVRISNILAMLIKKLSDLDVS